ncbi:MAG: ferrous iron transport protein B [Mycoplasmoidaceae bacterium]
MKKIKNNDNENYRIAFIGNPNVGKSSLINRYAKKNKLIIGNWHGVTVEKKELIIYHENKKYNFIDLPGIYDLNAKSIDAKITMSNIISAEYDLYVLVIDATKLKEGLFLLQQLKEINLPIFVIINFIDLIYEFGENISYEKIAKTFKTNVEKVSSKKKINIDGSLEKIIDYANNIKVNGYEPLNLYDNDLDSLKKEIYDNLKKQGYGFAMGFSNKENEKIIEFTTIKMIEKSNHFNSHIKMEKLDPKPINNLIAKFEGNNAMDAKDYLIKKRNVLLNNILFSFDNKSVNKKAIDRTISIDNVLLSKWGSLFFLFLIFFVSFIFIFNFSLPFKNWLDEFINRYIGGEIWKIHGMPKWLGDLVVNGILGGVGIVITFTPVIFLLFIWINILRESGYMARISFLLTRMFNSIGLSGKSIIPLVLGFGCNVTSIYASRTIGCPMKRRSTALLSPFMMCSARIPTVSLIIVSFFSQYAPLILIFSYMLGIIVAIILGYVIKIFYNKRVDDITIDELPLYNIPSFKIIIHSSCRNMVGFLKKASTLILLFSIIIWVISYFPHSSDPGHHPTSILFYFSKYFGYVFYPLGFGHIWQFVATIIPAISAKEVVISTLGTLTNHSESFTPLGYKTLFSDLGQAVISAFKGLVPIYWFSSFYQSTDVSGIASWMQTGEWHSFGPFINRKLIAFSFMVFILLTIPCITTLAVMRKEFGNKITLQSIGLGILIPYIASMLIYWTGFAFTQVFNIK